MSRHAAKMTSMWYRIWFAVKVFANERLGIRTWEDLRMQVHVLSPYAVSAMVTWNIIDESRAKLIVAFVLAVASPALAVWNTRDGFRRWAYGLLPALQALLVGFGYFTDSQLTPLIAAVVAVLGGGLAATNTNTSRGPNDTRVPVDPDADTAPLPVLR